MAIITPLVNAMVRWFEDPDDAFRFDEILLSSGIERAVGAQGEHVLLFRDEWSERYFQQKADVALIDRPVRDNERLPVNGSAGKASG